MKKVQNFLFKYRFMSGLMLYASPLITYRPKWFFIAVGAATIVTAIIFNIWVGKLLTSNATCSRQKSYDNTRRGKKAFIIVDPQQNVLTENWKKLSFSASKPKIKKNSDDYRILTGYNTLRVCGKVKNCPWTMDPLNWKNLEHEIYLQHDMGKPKSKLINNEVNESNIDSDWFRRFFNQITNSYVSPNRFFHFISFATVNSFCEIINL